MAERKLFTQNKAVGKSRLRQNVESILLALMIALAVRSSVVQAFWVPSGSMLPTIQIGDHIFVNKLAYGFQLPFVGQVAKFSTPHRNDIVVFVSPVDHSTDLIKRIVAVAGDQVEIRKKRLYVNGTLVDEPYAHFMDQAGHLVPEAAYMARNGDGASATGGAPRDNYGPITVPDGKFFVLGDNRDRSYDSRFWGFADVDDVKGRATFVYWSWDSENKWPRINRFFHFIR
jgi:signal peptidase I